MGVYNLIIATLYIFSMFPISYLANHYVYNIARPEPVMLV